MNDQEIVHKIRQGDEKVLEYLYRQHYRMMVNHVIRNNGTEDEAKDIYQEALIVFWQKVSSDSLILTSKISTYLYSICQNQWRKELDRRSRLSYEEKDSVEYIEPESDEKLKIVMDCLDELGDPCKSLLMAHYFDGLNMTQIANKMGFANSDTAKTKKYKCKMRLDILIKQKFDRNDFFS